MNKVILMGRLTRDPEIRYSKGANSIAVTRFTLAVNRLYKRDGEPDADFINIVAFGKRGEFAAKYFKKGQMVSIVGHMRIESYDENGTKRWTTKVIVDEQYFAESKKQGQHSVNNNLQSQITTGPAEGFYPINDDDDDLPF